MPVHSESYHKLMTYLQSKKLQLVAVSKTKPLSDILELFQLGQLDFGENYVQELVEKAAQLPKEIHWHFIGHLQSNKVKYIAPFVYMVHGVDSEKLLQEINHQAKKNNRIIHVLLQVHIASEETKYGFDESSLLELIQSGRIKDYSNIMVRGLMGMASFSDDQVLIQKEFNGLNKVFLQVKTLFNHDHFDTLSMGMSSDYELAIKEGSTLLRIGSLLFGGRGLPN